MPRKYCINCEYPETTCLCDCVAIIDCPLRIDILQHPSEQRAAKNTARLVKLCMPSCNLWVGETMDDFSDLIAQLQQAEEPSFVLFPNENSKEGSKILPQSVSGPRPRLIFIDGTWKKAYKIWQLNPWLHGLTSLHFENVVGEYEIRKARKPHQLSTLESVAKSLNLYSSDIDVSPLLSCFHSLKRRFQGV